MTRDSRARIKRVYELPADDDGVRILVDRLWPRGVTKANARVDRWIRDIAPSTELRKWFNHEQSRFNEFRLRYVEELEANEELVRQLKADSSGSGLTLLYAARDPQCNHAVVLCDYLRQFCDQA